MPIDKSGLRDDRRRDANRKPDQRARFSNYLEIFDNQGRVGPISGLALSTSDNLYLDPTRSWIDREAELRVHHGIQDLTVLGYLLVDIIDEVTRPQHAASELERGIYDDNE